MKKAIWCIEGMRSAGTNFHNETGYPLFVDSPVGDDIDQVIIMGMYDGPTYKHTLEMTKRAKTKHIHWCGSDVLYLANASILPEATHTCESMNLQEELYQKGIEAKILMQSTSLHVPLRPLPKTPVVSCYLGSDPQKYGVSLVKACMDAMPEYKFVTYQYGHQSPQEMVELIEKSTVHLRLAPHDGSALSCREMMEAGRYCVTATDLPFAWRVRFGDLQDTLKKVRKGLMMKEPNTEAAEYYSEWNSSERFKWNLEEMGL